MIPLAMPPAPVARVAAVRPVPVGVTESEWDIVLGRRHVRTGRLKLNISNYGEDTHDLVVRDSHGRILAHTDDLASYQQHTLRVRLRRPGHYTLFCDLPGHYAKGMHARLVVRRRHHRH